MTPGEREKAAAYLDETRDRLLRTAQNLSPMQLQYKPAPERWSAAECLEHITLVENLVLGNIHNTLKGSVGAPTTEMGDDALVRRVTNRSVRVDRARANRAHRPRAARSIARRIRGDAPPHRRNSSRRPAYRCASTRFHILASARWIAISGCFSSPATASAIASRSKS